MKDDEIEIPVQINGKTKVIISISAEATKEEAIEAGLGNRLKPLTDTTPKALLPVDGKPMLEHVILKLKDAGLTDCFSPAVSWKG
mgnify:CR=1 FL=1